MFVDLLLAGAPICFLSALWLLGRRGALDLRVSRWRIIAPRLPPEQKLRFVHLTDLHVPARRRLLERTISLVAEADPELIFITGDFVSRPKFMPVAREFLGQLGEIAPIYGVTGNGEYWRQIPIAELAEILAATGGRLLDNEWVEVEAGASTVLVSGVSDPELEHDCLRDAVPPGATAPCRLLLAHSPLIWDQAADLAGDYDLVLCGHTHGGQARVPWYGPLDAHTQAPRQLISGLFELPLDPSAALPRTLYDHHAVLAARGETLEADRSSGPLLYTNRGVGAAGLPLRFLCPPEVAIFDLVGPGAD